MCVKNGLSVKLTSHLHLVTNMRLRGFLSLLVKHVFLAWCLGTGTSFPLRKRKQQSTCKWMEKCVEGSGRGTCYDTFSALEASSSRIRSSSTKIIGWGQPCIFLCFFWVVSFYHSFLQYAFPLCLVFIIFFFFFFLWRIRCSSVSIGSRLRATWLELNSWQEQGFYLFTTASRPVLRPTQPPIKWVPGELSPGIKRWGVKLTTRLHLVPMLRMRGAIPPLPQTSSWHGI